MARKNIDTTKLRAAFEKEMRNIGTDILAESKRQVPVKEGTLSRSAVKTARWEGDNFVVSISYNTPYAAVQHENRTFNHPTKGKAKYLEDPMKQMFPKVEKRLAAAMRRAIG